MDNKNNIIEFDGKSKRVKLKTNNETVLDKSYLLFDFDYLI